MRSLQRRLRAKEDSQDACYFVPQSGVEKIIINMVDSDHDMRDTVVQVIGPWEAELEDEHGAIPIIWNLGPVLCEGALLIVDIEAKLQKLTAIDRDYYNWSWLLGPNRPHVSLVLPKVSALGRCLLAAELGSPALNKSPPAIRPWEVKQVGCFLPRRRGRLLNLHNLRAPR